MADVGHTQAPSPDTRAVVAGNIAFATELYGALRANSGNLFFSPSSISTALAMTYAGAGGKTAEEMAHTLHFTLPQPSLPPAYAALETELKTIQQKGRITLEEANSLWPQEGYPLLPDFLSICQKDYSSPIHHVDFAGNTEGARTTINDWVSDKTHGKITELLNPGILDKLTRLVLVNAIYFKGKWASPFNVTLTKEEAFHLSSEKTVPAPLMRKTHEFRYAEFPDLQVLELPYAGDDLSMLILLPRANDGLTALESTVTPQNLTSWTSQLRPRMVDLVLPKFKITESFSLKNTLESLGMPTAFGPGADFSGMDGKTILYIGAVEHKAFVEVNEEGTEAAAATAVVMNLMSVAAAPPRFRADHPFLFLIRENHTGSILFLGRMSDPTK